MTISAPKTGREAPPQRGCRQNRASSSVAKSIFLIAVVPVSGLIVYRALLTDCLHLTDFPTLFLFPGTPDGTPQDRDAHPIQCFGASVTNWVGPASIVSLLIGFFVPIAAWVAGAFRNSNKTTLKKTFPPFAIASVIAVVVFYVLQWFILGTVAYYAVVQWLGREMIVVIGMAMVFGSFMPGLMLYFLAKEFRLKGLKFEGLAVTPSEQPELHAIVKSVADAIDSRSPDNIILGLELSFEILTEKVRVFGKHAPLEGSTLFLSLPLLHAISKNELRAVVGHELAHLKAGDTMLGSCFASSYNALTLAIALLDSHDPKTPNLFGLPAKTILKPLLPAFALDDPQAFHRKEFVADQVGAKASSHRDMANVLLKIALFQELWADEEQAAPERHQSREIGANTSKNFIEHHCRNFDSTKLDQLLEEILQNEEQHLSITHPSTRARIHALGMLLNDPDNDLQMDLQFPPGVTAADSVDGLELYESRLSALK